MIIWLATSWYFSIKCALPSVFIFWHQLFYTSQIVEIRAEVIAEEKNAAGQPASSSYTMKIAGKPGEIWQCNRCDPPYLLEKPVLWQFYYDVSGYILVTGVMGSDKIIQPVAESVSCIDAFSLVFCAGRGYVKRTSTPKNVHSLNGQYPILPGEGQPRGIIRTPGNWKI